MRYALLLLLSAWALLAQDVAISQVYGGGGNAGAPLRNDFIELLNRGNAPVPLTGWSVQYASATGTTWQVTPLSGTIQPGRYFLVQQAAGANAAAPALPTADISGEIAMGAAAGQVRLMRDATQVDYVAYSNLSNTTAALRRNGGCGADFSSGAPNPRNSSSPAVDCAAPPELPLSATIAQIQGPGAQSPLEGRVVQTRGVVTGRKSNGFWIQSLPSDNDGDPLTSEGLWVFLGVSPPGTVDRGYVVQVTGRVLEFRPAADPASAPLTELVDATVQVTEQGQALPAPVALAPGEDWERYEGMRVAVPEARVVGATLGSVDAATALARSTGVFYVTLPGQARPFRSVDASERVERLRVDMRAQSAALLDVPTGATVQGLIGPLDYAFDTYTIAQDAMQMTAVGGGMRAAPVPAPGASEFTIATMNLQQLWDERDDPGLDVPVQPDALQRRLNKMARAVRDVLRSPDIIGVQEAENEGVLRGLARAAGDYDAFLTEGDDPSGIDVGLLVKRGRVVVRDAVQEGRGELIPGTNDRVWDRPPLAARVTVQGVPLTVIVVHLRSLIDADTATVAAKRQAQFSSLARLVQARTAGGEQIALIGDFNTFQFDPLPRQALAGLLNLTDTLAPSESYTYVFDGEMQAIDHVFVSDGLRSRLTRYAVARVNADFPEVWRNTELERYSDHDVPVAYFTLAPESLQVGAAGVLNAATFLGGAVAPLELITIFGRGLGPQQLVTFEAAGLAPSLGGTRVLFDGVPADLIYTSAGQVSAIVPSQIAGRTTTLMQVEYQGRLTDAVLLPVAPAAPGIFTLSRDGRGQGAILNQDFSVNGVGAPAERGSVVMIYGTGGGQLLPTVGDVPARLMQPVSVRIGGRPVEVLYAGQAPGLVPGVIQINARVPVDAGVGDLPVVITAGDRISAFGVTVSVR